ALEPLARIVHCRRRQGPQRRTLLREAARSDVLICFLTERIDEELLRAAPRLRFISNYAAGVDNVDVAFATRRGIPIGHTPGVLTDATADLAFALLLACARRIPEAERFMRAQRSVEWEPALFLGADLSGRTLGLIGFGRIGRAVARRARGFSMKILYHARHRAPRSVERSLGAAYAPLRRLLRESDFVSLHVPLSPMTRHMIGPAALRLMKRTAILVNTSRGAVVDERALARTLARGRIAGAALDVYEKEPAIHPSLLRAQNALLVPHIGSATVRTRRRMAEIAVANVAAFLRGEIPPFVVNPEAFRVKRG
ncbi:MAG: 2-hydroxyacid dehydrogenase, partial [Vicinamibacteria bacterium]